MNVPAHHQPSFRRSHIPAGAEALPDQRGAGRLPRQHRPGPHRRHPRGRQPGLARRIAAFPGRRFTFGPGLRADDPGPPPRITHGCAFMIHPNGWTEFHYDYLDYYWTVDGEEVRARHYLDDRELPKVQVFVLYERFRGEAFAGMLAYL